MKKIWLFDLLKKTVGCFKPKIKNSCSVSAYFMAVQTLVTVESLSSACLKSLEFTDKRFILLVP